MTKANERTATRHTAQAVLSVGALLLAVGLGVAGGASAAFANGKSGHLHAAKSHSRGGRFELPAPSIVATPSTSPTNQASISFALADREPGVTYRCWLDGAVSTCSGNMAAYQGLADGSHTFTAQAVAGRKASRASSYGWVVDTTPPPLPLILSGPALTGTGAVSSTSAVFTFCDDDNTTGCDPAGQVAATLYCSLDGAAFAACSSPVSFTGLDQGPHAFQVYAVDPAGNRGPTRTWGWIIDTDPPAAPVFTTTAASSSDGVHVTFAWTESSNDVSAYMCSTDHGPYVHCATPLSFTVAPQNSGTHSFSVYSVDLGGNQSAPATFSW